MASQITRSLVLFVLILTINASEHEETSISPPTAANGVADSAMNTGELVLSVLAGVFHIFTEIFGIKPKKEINLQPQSRMLPIPYDGFSRPVENSLSRWFVQGQSYFESVENAIENAEHEIFIAGLEIRMEMELSRPLTGGTLGKLLKSKAKSGVKVYVMLFGSHTARTILKLKLGSKKTIEMYHGENFEVIEHTSKWKDASRWAPHEKMVVVDRTTAFVGGIDMTQSRWDNSSFSMFDDDSEYFVGIDYRNAFLQDEVEDNEDFYKEILDRSKPRMPWQDISSVVYGKAANGASRHFRERWNWVIEQNYETDTIGDANRSDNMKKGRNFRSYIQPDSIQDYKLKTRIQILKEQHKIDGSKNPQMSKLHTNVKTQTLRSVSNWATGNDIPEKSVQKAYIDLIKNSKKFIYIENQYFITSINENHNNFDNLIGKELFLRIMKAHDENKQFKVFVMVPLLKESYMKGDMFAQDSECDLVNHLMYNSIYKPKSERVVDRKQSLLTALEFEGINPENYRVVLFKLSHFRKMDVNYGHSVKSLQNYPVHPFHEFEKVGEQKRSIIHRVNLRSF